MNSFTTLAKLGLKYYIYALICPITNKIFYIGKGSGNRVFEHTMEADKFQDSKKYKLEKINELKSKGLSPKYVILKHGIEDEKLAYEYEATMIDMFTNPNSPLYGTTELTNDVSGHHTELNGVKTVEQIQAQYDCEEISCQPGDKIVCIHINKYVPKDQLWNRAKGMWRMSKQSLEKAKQANFAIVEYQGLVIGAFINLQWFAEDPLKKCKRYYFTGDYTEDCIYLNKIILPKRVPGRQWPLIFLGY